MMPHEVPTHLSREDRLMFGLTLRQLLIVGIGGLAAAWVGNTTGWPAGFITMAPVALLTLVVTFIRPHGRGLEEWVFIVLQFYAMPRIATWQPGFGPGGVSDDTSDAFELVPESSEDDSEETF